MKSRLDLGNERQVLFKNRIYSYLIIKQGEDDSWYPVQHYRPQHSFSYSNMPSDVSWGKPLHISTIAIVDKPREKYSIAIKSKMDLGWRRYDLSKAQFIDQGDYEIVYLPPFENLEAIESKLIKK